VKDEKRIQEMDDEQVEAALRNFRASVHGWSEQEFSRARTIKRSPWDAVFRALAHPVMAWTLASALVVTSVGVPVKLHHDREAAAESAAAIQRQRALEKATAAQEAANSMTDDELMDHVDSDIAQAAPDAMQPLASLMTDTSAK
jgi:hypothetical protein